METTNNKIYAPALWPYRLLGNLLLIGGIWLITFGVITIRHNLVSKHIDSLMTELYNKTATVGWGLMMLRLKDVVKHLKMMYLELLA